MFEVFEPDSEPGRLYRALVAEPGSTVEGLAERTGLAAVVVERRLTELASAGAVLDVGRDRWDAQSPEVVTETALQANEATRTRIRSAEGELRRVFEFARRTQAGYDAIEVLDGKETFFSYLPKLESSVRTQMRAIDRPPYYWDEAEIARQEQYQCERMAAGISYRTIYQESARDSPARSASMMRTVASGERARVLEDPPVKLGIFDEHTAFIAFDPPAGATVDSLVVLLIHQSGLLDSVINIFEALWKLAVPVTLAGIEQSLDDCDREILTMMASGATDDAIARRLNLSRRTVVRRVAKLLERLGAATRFQAGAQAARRGWL